MTPLPTLPPGQLMHDAWRSVRVSDPAYASDERLHMSYEEIANAHQALCIVTEGRIQRAIGRQLLSDGDFDIGFVRKTMEEVYDGYNRFTLCITGLAKSGLDWFTDSSSEGINSIRSVPPYNALSPISKDIDRRMVVLILSTLGEDKLPSHQTEAIKSDASAILDTAYTGVFYDYTLGYASEASFD